LVSISKIFRLTRVRIFALTVLVFAGLALMNALQVGQSLENQGLDVCYRFRPPSPPPPELLIVEIDEHSFQELRKAWPWPRRYHAELIRHLKAAGARLIVFDVLFVEPTDPADDQLLTEAIREAGNVILATTIEVSEDSHVSREMLVQPHEPFRQAALGVGLPLVTPDGDGIVRRFHLRLSEERTLAEVVAKCYHPNLVIPPHLSGLIHFSGPPGHLNAVSYSDLLKKPCPSLAACISGKIVLVGLILEASPTPLVDSFYTPFFASSGRLMSGVEVHGQIIDTLLHKDWGRELGLLPKLGLYLVVLVLFGCLVARVSPFAAMGVLAGFILLIYGLSFYLFLRWNLWVPPLLLSGGLAMVCAGHIFAYYCIESWEKRWLRHAFGHYVSDSLVEAIIAHPERLQLGGEEVEVTVLFADLVDFSTFAEKAAPKELIHLLDEFFSAMTEVILEHKGTLDKFIGDAIMAFWGAPLPLADHAVLACEAALEMQKAMHLLEDEWEAQGFPKVSARIGLHSGPVIAGNVGSRKRFNYTVMGDTVNLAARLEGANKTYGTEIILSEATYRRVGNNSFLVRKLGLVQVQGRTQPVNIYELLSRMSPHPPPVWLKSFEAGWAAYLAGEWLAAADHFREVLTLKPDDQVTKVFLKRCHKYQDKPPLPDWRGIFVLENK
jgi:adenylate cyclase